MSVKKSYKHNVLIIIGLNVKDAQVLYKCDAPPSSNICLHNTGVEIHSYMICLLSFIKQPYILFQKYQPILAKLSSNLASPMPVKLRLALSLIITTPRHTPTPGKVEKPLEINHYGQKVAGR